MAKQSVTEKYKTYLMLERGLSGNSVEAYIDDLNKLLNFLGIENLRVEEVRLEHLQQFIAQLYDLGISARTVARCISGIKSFYGFLLTDGYIQSDPTELLEMPKIGLKLPSVLSVEEIDMLMQAIDLSTKEGRRNKAILEVLYSCGLRISELVKLKFSDLFLDEGFIRVEGKGSKQRLAPISPAAIREIHNYMPDRMKEEARKGHEHFLFLSKRKTAISRIMVFHFIKEYAALANIGKNISPHTFRHSFAT
ncbi:MAG: tyrosine-type recombinase/integrase, partial [Prevotella sp.]|nr:tyrosine-type recombinase/integrase [Prevotella sp.]